MVQRETFGSYIANSVIWKLDHYTIINCCTWCCWFYLLVEIVVKPNQSKTDISNNKNTKFEKLLTMTRVYNFVEYCCSLFVLLNYYWSKSGMVLNSVYEVDQKSGAPWWNNNFVENTNKFLTKFEILSWWWPHCWPRDWAAKFTRTLWGSRRRITQLIVVYKFSRPFFIEFSPYW